MSKFEDSNSALKDGDPNKLLRRDIRYWLFTKKDIESGARRAKKSLPKNFTNIINHYEQLENFPGWDGFAAPLIDQFTGLRVTNAWDIGIDDLITQATRPEKSWLFGTSKYKIVLRGNASDGLTALEIDEQTKSNPNLLQAMNGVFKKK